MLDNNSFLPVSIQEICPTLSYSFECRYSGIAQFVDILLIRFSGKYRYGSAGSDDALLIDGVIKMGMTLFDPNALIIDLREMSYEWGDNLDLSFGSSAVKTTVVVGVKCRKAMSTLAYGLESKQDIVDNDFFFDDLEAAISNICNH
ncbi:MAG: hypothetical protein J7527_04800 [Chitinophagaceae bacterium]|nr:hypothetical protein [Chitinophagaceae bacterium]